MVLSDTNGDHEPEILQDQAYYPFGLEIADLSMSNLANPNDYRYNGKELNEEFGLDWYCYGARNYDPILARFPSVDPIADQFAFVSPFNYAENRPVNGIDLWGLQYVNVNTGSVGPFDPLDSTSGVSETYDVNGNNEQDHYLPVVTVTPTPSNQTINESNNEISDHARMEKVDDIASFSEGFNSALGSSSTLYGASFTLAAELHYSPKVLGTWLGKNGKLYNTNWGGNQYTGGKLKYAQNMSSSLKVGANMLAVVSYGTIGMDYYSAIKEAGGYPGHSKTITTTADAAVNTAGVISPYGAFFAACWEIGRVVTYTNTYQNFKHNYVLKTQGGRDGLISTDK